jgi:urease accessory protein
VKSETAGSRSPGRGSGAVGAGGEGHEENANLALIKLLQLASPALPVGAYSYSQGLEAAIENGIVKDEASALCWIEDVLSLSVATMEAPVFLRLCDAWRSGDLEAARHWNALFLASRESAELRAETVQMGYSLAALLRELDKADAFDAWPEMSFPAAFTRAAVRWRIDARDALVAYLWSWAENQVLAAVKAVPLGQAAGQRMLATIGPALVRSAAQAAHIADDEMSNFAPGLALVSALHETQYTRLFRS